MSKEKKDNNDEEKFEKLLTIAISYDVPVTYKDLKKKNQQKKDSPKPDTSSKSNKKNK